MIARDRVAAPPAKPVLVFDGDCTFCRRWIARWRQSTGEAVEYLAFQEPARAVRYPELSIDRLKRAVHLVDVDGRVTSGAEAVFRSLERSGTRVWPWAYHAIPGFAPATEWFYRLVADHRNAADRITTLLWGRRLERPSFLLSRWVFLRLLGAAYLAAFGSLGTQVLGLVGSHGILPAQPYLNEVTRFATEHGLSRYHVMPTLFWLDASDAALRVACGGGVAFSIALIVGLAPVPALLLLWALYLSLVTVGREFLSFQWDALLLEVGMLAVFVAPLTWRERPGRDPRSRPLARGLLLWLLFRFILGSGAIKLASGDPTWASLTALTYHYWTQPLPTRIGWFANQLPTWFQRLSCGVMFVIELGAPWLIPAPRRLRLLAFGMLVGLQLLIALTGNYAFFNLLTISLCILLVDDHDLARLVPRRWRDQTGGAAASQPLGWPRWIAPAFAVTTVPISILMLANSFQIPLPVPTAVGFAYEWVAPFRLVNTYGLFATMTTTRPEIVIEGSRDGTTWVPYVFRDKPGDVLNAPRFVAPHQPRLDWQMWFAALGACEQNPWVVNFAVRLLQGSPDVLALLGPNPFNRAPPREIRVMRYDYRFTDRAMRAATGAWWRRELLGEYCPPLSLSSRP